MKKIEYRLQMKFYAFKKIFLENICYDDNYDDNILGCGQCRFMLQLDTAGLA